MRHVAEAIIVFILATLLLDWMLDVDQRLHALEGGAKILKGPWPDREDTAS